MRVLLAGAGGQVARAIMTTLPEGVTLIPLTRSELDITDREAVHAIIQRSSAQVLINAAAFTAVDRAEAEPEAAYAINGAAVSHLVEACATNALRLIHISTDFVFDGSKSRAYRPDDPVNPLSIYGCSKLAGEQAALAEPSSLVIRSAWIYSVHGANFVCTMLRVMAEREAVSVVVDQIGTPTHAVSLARSIWALVENQERGIFHVTDAGVASWYDFAIAIQEEALQLGLLKRSIPILPIMTETYPTPAKRPPFSVLDKSATWHVMGYPAAHWRQELRVMLSELKASICD